ncbi:hypothetical protein GCM10009720_21180 [Yaniella flava]|uniref:Uncharacterized protein n=1 Tax=Yaniella flava TaxID=287930 RepID=A0ABP5G9Q7_9MICC
MGHQTTSYPKPSAWERFQSVAKFVITVLGWGPLAFAVAIPLIATVSLTVDSIWSWFTQDITLSTVIFDLFDSIGNFIAASTDALVPIIALGIICLGIGLTARHIGATMRNRQLSEFP